MTFKLLNPEHPLSAPRLGEGNTNWKGDKVGYSALHEWIRKRKLKPLLCERCGLEPPRDLANKSDEYRRTLDDWEWLCRRCHMTKDGRMEKVIAVDRARRIYQKIPCANCGTVFQSRHDKRKFCSQKCYHSSKKGGNGGQGVH